jgi:hypothetical protein
MPCGFRTGDMPVEKLVPLALPPGAYRNGTKYQAKGRFYDTNLVRWLEGILRPVGGWQEVEWSASGVTLIDSQHFVDITEPVVLSDTFVDSTPGILLESHPPVGSPTSFTWQSAQDTTSASLVIDTTSGIFLPRDNDNEVEWPQYFASTPMGGADYEVEVDALVRNSTFSTDFGGVGARLTGGTQQGGYAFGIIEDPSQPMYALYVFDTDGSILSGVTSPVPLTDLGTVVTLKIRCFGSTITGLVNNVQVFQITDTTYALEGEPGLVLGWSPNSVTTTSSSGSGSQFQWFKQAGYSPVTFDTSSGDTLVYHYDFSFNENIPYYTVGVPTGHLGDTSPVLPADYQVSAIVHTHAVAAVAGTPPFTFGTGVVARVPLNAAFFEYKGYFFTYYQGNYRMFCSDNTSIHPFDISTSVPVIDQDTDVTMSIRVQGSLIEGIAAGVTVLSTTNSTFAVGGRAGLIDIFPQGAGAYMKGPWTVFDLSSTPLLKLSDTLIDVPGTILERHVPVPIDPVTGGTTIVSDTDLGFRPPFVARRITTANPPDTSPSVIFSDICLAGLPRGSWAWKTNDGGSWFAVGTTTDAYKFSDGLIHGLSPWAAEDSSATSWADTTFGAARVNGAFSGGKYGRGPYGLGKYGTGTGALTLVDADTWSFDNFDQQLVGCFTLTEHIYRDNDTLGRFELVPNAPSARAIVVTPERFLFALGADNDIRKVQWCDQGDLETWDGTDLNQAGAYFLTTRGKLKCGLRTRRQTLLWTDADFHAATYIGGEFIYRFDQLGDHCGIISPHAASVVGDVAYWMSYGRFFVYDGATKPLSCDVQDFVFGDFQQKNREKVWSMTMTQFDEVWWFYPSASQTGLECDRYVIFNYRDGAWYFGALDRGTGVDRDVFEFPLMVGNKPIPNDPNCVNIFEHEFGDKRDGIAFAETGPLELSGTAKSGPMADSYSGDIGGSLQRVQYIVPDEKNQGDIRFYIYTTNYPSVPEKEHGPFSSVNPTPVRFTARQVRLRYEENPGVPQESWRVGIPRLADLPAGRR